MFKKNRMIFFHNRSHNGMGQEHDREEVKLRLGASQCQHNCKRNELDLTVINSASGSRLLIVAFLNICLNVLK